MVYPQLESILDNETLENLWGFELKQITYPSEKNTFWWLIKKKTYFVIPVDHRVKIKERKKRNKFLYLVKEVRKLWNIKVTMIIIVIVALRAVSKCFKRRL